MEAKRIVITGVSRGLGRALTSEFIEHGHVVVGCGRSVEAMQELSRSFPSPSRFDAVDVSEFESVQAWADDVLEQGPPDLLINNAATINPNAELWETDVETFGQIVDINIKGVFHVVRAFTPAMIARDSGVIVNLSSTWGRSVSPQVAPYCATKWAVEGMTRALASELPHGLAAIPLNPGIIHTDMLESCFGPSAAAYPSPQDWARKAAPFLLELGPHDNGDPLTAPS